MESTESESVKAFIRLVFYFGDVFVDSLRKSDVFHSIHNSWKDPNSMASITNVYECVKKIKARFFDNGCSLSLRTLKESNELFVFFVNSFLSFFRWLVNVKLVEMKKELLDFCGGAFGLYLISLGVSKKISELKDNISLKKEISTTPLNIVESHSQSTTTTSGINSFFVEGIVQKEKIVRELGSKVKEGMISVVQDTFDIISKLIELFGIAFHGQCIGFHLTECLDIVRLLLTILQPLYRKSLL